jgi:hypothetical protein
MNALELTLEGRYTAHATPRKLVVLIQYAEDEHGPETTEVHLTPAEARLLAEQIDSGQSMLEPDDARHLALEIFGATVEANALKPLPETVLAVFERLHWSDQDSIHYHAPDDHAVCRLGLIAMQDLASKSGLDREAVQGALNLLKRRDLIHDVDTAKGMAQQIRIGKSPARRNAEAMIDADIDRLT